MLLMFGLLFTYVNAPLAVYGLAARALRPGCNMVGRIFLLTAGLGPLVIAWILWFLLLVFPGHSLTQYAAVIVTAVEVATFVGRREIVSLLSRTPNYLPILMEPWRERVGSLRILWILVIFLLLSVLAQALTLPIQENDTLEYMLIAKYIISERTMSVYPLVQAVPHMGLYANASHPPAFHMIIGWSYMFGGFDNSRAIRFIGLFYFSISAMNLCDVSRRFTKTGGIQAVLMLLLTPFFARFVVDHFVDTPRLATSLAALLLAAIVIERRGDLRWTILCGVVTGFSLFTHSIGLLTLGFVGLALLFFMDVPFREKVRVIGVMTAIALSIGGWQYIFNTIQFGVPFQDNEPVMADPMLNYTDDIKYRRDILDLPLRLTYGVFQLFSRVELAGFSAWLALLSEILMHRTLWARMDLRVLLMTILVFLSMSLVTTFVGTDLMIKNIRYAMTLMFPMVAIAACGLGCFFCKSRNRLVRGSISILFILMAIPWFLYSISRLYDRAAPYAIWKGNEWQVLSTQTFPGSAALFWARKNVSPEELVLTYRQPDYAYYVGTPWIRDIDPRLMPVYKADTPQKTFRMLRELGVRYIFMPDYMWPTVYNTQIMRLIGDPTYSALAATDRGYKIYRLHDSPMEFACKPLLLDNIFGLWLLKGSTLAGIMGLGEKFIWLDQLLAAGYQRFPFSFNWKNTLGPAISHEMLVIGREHPIFRSSHGIKVPPGGGLLRITGKLYGSAFIQASLVQLTSDDVKSVQSLADMVVRPEGNNIVAQIPLEPDVNEVALQIQSSGRTGGDVTLDDVSMCFLSNNDETIISEKDKKNIFTMPLRYNTKLNLYTTRDVHIPLILKYVQNIFYTIDHTKINYINIINVLSSPLRHFYPKPATDWTNYELILKGKPTGIGVIEVYVSWRNITGNIVYRLIGNLFWDGVEHERSLSFRLPKEATDFGVHVIASPKSAIGIELINASIFQ